MKNFKSIGIMLLLALFLSSTVTSCMTTKTTVGKYKQTEGEVYKYSKGKQLWLFWGLLPIGRTNVNTPEDGNCEIVTRFTFGDFIIGVVTFGILKPYTIKVNIKK